MPSNQLEVVEDQNEVFLSSRLFNHNWEGHHRSFLLILNVATSFNDGMADKGNRERENGSSGQTVADRFKDSFVNSLLGKLSLFFSIVLNFISVHNNFLITGHD